MMKAKTILVLFSIFIFSCMNAQQLVKLWGKKGAPTSNEIKDPENVDRTGWITNVSEATITIYLPKESNNRHAAVIICPGGGYAGLAARHEGSQVAEWLQEQGIAGIVLKYRLPNKHTEIPLADVQQAMRYVHSHAKTLNIDEHKIGIAGFSAGGHLAATASTHFYTQKTMDGTAVIDSIVRPSFSMLFYPVITMGKATHGGSRDNLLGDNPTQNQIQLYSNELQITKNTPPTILMLSDDDDVVPTQNSVSYYEGLKKQNIPATMYIFPEGGHGWGMNTNFKYHTEMLSLLKSWLDKTLK